MNIMESMRDLCLSNTALANEILPEKIKELVMQQCKTHSPQEPCTSNGEDDAVGGNPQHSPSHTRQGALTLAKAT